MQKTAKKQRLQAAPEDRQIAQQEYNDALRGADEGYNPDENSGNDMMDALMQEEAELKKKYPEFDLKYMLRTNEGFARRMLRGYTQRSLSEALLLSESFIAKLESKTYQTISIDTLELIAEFLDVDITCFFDKNVK